MSIQARLNSKVEKLAYAIQKRRALLAAKSKQQLGIDVTVRLISNFPRLWERIIEQTPGGSCRWGNTLFLAEGEADLYVILNTGTHDYAGNPLPPIDLPSPDRVWGLHTEPLGYVKLFNLDSFEEHQKISRFYTNCEHLYRQEPARYIPSPPYVFMHVDRSWDFLYKTSLPRKVKDLSMIASGLEVLDGHKERLEFIDRLVDSNLDFSLWGRGQQFTKYSNYRGVAPTKWEVMSACKYSIVVENSVSPFYWTEKIADSLLSFSLPLYYGSPNVSEYLPENCYVPIDIHDPDCADQIRAIVTAREYEKRLPAILAARQEILQKQNLFAFLNREINQHFVSNSNSS